MKKIIYKILILSIIPLAYWFIMTGFKGTEPAPQTSFTGSEGFINTIFNTRWDVNNQQYWLENFLGDYGSGGLHFNAIQNYEGGSDRFGYFDQQLSQTQINNGQDVMTGVENAGLLGLFSKVKIYDLCFNSQRLIYEVSNGGSTTVNDGFCWQTTSGEYTTDQGRTVLHLCPTNCPNQDATPRYMATGIYENIQHSDFIQPGDGGTWFLKPMMRVDSSFVDNNPTANVMKIEIYKFNDGTTPLKTVIIKARNFAHFDVGSGTYI